MAPVTMLEGIRQAIFEEMDRDPAVVALGEDIGVYGGAFKVTEGLLERFGRERVIETPISETAIVGAA
ncbi:MAG TPA: alpha-ketoacid dehydrogenase subunit beta, partial [Candidatus Acidoferrales bacterium]|nr:alpha-ketoacid dehydrogenase subunit beta [Candidatus Acidoferrales bacterium]